MGDGASPRPEQPDHSNFAVVFPAFLGDNYVIPVGSDGGKTSAPHNSERQASAELDLPLR